MSFFQENGFRVSTNHVAEFRAICRVAVWWKSDSDLGLIGFRDGDETAVIYTAQRRIAKLKNNRAARLVEEGTDDGAVWARFELRANVVSFRSKKRGMTDESERAGRSGFAL
jgi:hypothetical protein